MRSVFWEPRLNNYKSISFHDAVESFGAKFGRSVEQHLLSDVPVASYLSAGLDSASVFATGSKIYSQNFTGIGLTAYTGKFDIEGGWYDETKPASLLTSKLNSEHRKTSIKPHDLETFLDDGSMHWTNPRWGWEPFLSTWLLSMPHRISKSS